jgi:hypothetical protein
VTPAEQAHLDQVERDRRRREALLLLLLLSYSDRAARQARAAVRVGADPVEAAADAIRGRESLATGPHVHWPGLQTKLVPVITEAFYAGVVRAAQMVGVTFDVPEEPPPPPVAEQQAADLADKTAAAVSRIVAGAVEEAEATGVNAAKTVRLIGESFDAAGMTHARSHAAEAAAERQVVNVYGWGQLAAWEHKSTLGRVLGFRYNAVLDEGTTPICRAYHGITLPTSHQWFKHHWPQNHWGCRGTVTPVTRKFTATEPVYFPEPAAGFGEAPIFAFGTLVGA